MYCTKADMLGRFHEYDLIQLTDETHSNVIDDAVLEKAINDASAEIDSYLTGRYVTPLTNPTPDIIHKACDLTWFYLHLNRSENLERDNQIQRRYDAIIRFFEQVAKGVINLSVVTPDVKQQGSGTLICSFPKISWDF